MKTFPVEAEIQSLSIKRHAPAASWKTRAHVSIGGGGGSAADCVCLTHGPEMRQISANFERGAMGKFLAANMFVPPREGSSKSLGVPARMLAHQINRKTTHRDDGRRGIGGGGGTNADTNFQLPPTEEFEGMMWENRRADTTTNFHFTRDAAD